MMALQRLNTIYFMFGFLGYLTTVGAVEYHVMSCLSKHVP